MINSYKLFNCHHGGRGGGDWTGWLPGDFVETRIILPRSQTWSISISCFRYKYEVNNSMQEFFCGQVLMQDMILENYSTPWIRKRVWKFQFRIHQFMLFKITRIIKDWSYKNGYLSLFHFTSSTKQYGFTVV